VIREGGTKRRPALLCLALVVVLACLARLAAFRGFSASDDADYAKVAFEFSRGHFPPFAKGVPPQYPMRWGVAVPVGILFRLAGVSEFVLLLFPACVSASMIGLAYIAARHFFGPRAGCFAALLYAVMPIDAQFATWLLSDTPAALWAALGMLSVYWGTRRTSAVGKTVTGVAAGLFFGFSWLTRGQVVQMAPFVGAYLLVACRRERRNGWLLGGVALASVGVFASECVTYAVVKGDWMYRFHAMEQLYEMHRHWYWSEGGVYGWPPGQYAWGLARRWLKLGPAALLFNTNFALAPLFALIAVAHAAFWRKREFAFPATWFLWAAFAFNFGSASLRAYEPLPWMDSYMMPTLFPAVLLTAGWLAGMSSGSGEVGRERRFWLMAAGVVLSLAAAAGLFQRVRQGMGCPVVRRAQEALRTTPDAGALLYTDRRSRDALNFFWGYPEDSPARAFEDAPAGGPLSGALFFVNDHQLKRLADIVNYRPPDWVDRIQVGRNPVKEWQGGRVYRKAEPQGAGSASSTARSSPAAETHPAEEVPQVP